ncbi:hypothetical protein HAX54_046441 [Datura stramonium]|uniref:FCP1 homology domain-containing protein n=1 Tax=Datura stramonium TaxID=4076 RepID=A0ABS8WJH5_DATST|nr:hypothetical protein [Datura stramonium]
MLITYCRKRRNSLSLSTSIPDIVEDVAIQESKTKSNNVDTTLPDENFVFASETRSRQMYSRPRVLITYCRKRRRNSMSLASSIPAIEDGVIRESKTKTINIDITLPAESSEFMQVDDFAIETRSRQMYPRPSVLVTYSRKRRKNSVALASTIPAIVEDAVIQESKTKSPNVDITLPAESSESIEVNDFAMVTRSQHLHPRSRVLITYFKNRRNSSILGNSLPAFVENVSSSLVIQESKTQVTNSGPLSLSFFFGILDEVVITRDEIASVGAQQILVKAAGESSSVEHRNEKKILAMDNSTENSNSSACSTIKNVAHHAEFAEDGYARDCTFESSTNKIFDGEKQSLAESNSSPSSLCAFIDEKTEITNVGTIPPLRRALNGRSNKKLLVLDLNGLLADIFPLQYVPYGFKVDTIVSGKAVFKRPFHDDFLQFCFEKFNVGVWSSRIRKNVELVLDFLLGNAKEKLLFCWDQSHCTDTGFPVVGKRRNKPIILKKLKKLWEKFEPDLPWERGEYDESNTLLLDDSPHKALCNPPNTAVFPNTYRYTDERDDSLGPEGDLRVYLEGLSMAENVQKYIESNPFGQRPITEKNASWCYYRKVIEAATCFPEHSANRFSTYQ